jgi:hypothetical protein
MHVSGITVRPGRVSASIDGFELWLEFPAEFGPLVPGDVFLSAALLVAMKSGSTLTIDAPCSASLLENAREMLQDIFSAWYPGLCRIDVVAEAIPDQEPRDGVGSFFSGGVDGSYTFLRRRDEITHLISVQGIDVQVDNDELWSRVIAANAGFAERFGKTLVNVRTNIRRFCHPRGVSWLVLNGAGLAAIAHALGIGRYYVAASHTYTQLYPLGSHPLSDRLWGSDAISLIHDGLVSRPEKIKALSTCPEALRLLRVCWQDAGYNCNRCEKCLRTRIALRLLGLSTPTLEPLVDPREISTIKLWDDADIAFYGENLELAESVGDKPIAAALRRCLRGRGSRLALAELDRNVLGGAIQRLKSLVRRQRRTVSESPSTTPAALAECRLGREST